MRQYKANMLKTKLFVKVNLHHVKIIGTYNKAPVVLHYFKGY